MSIKRRGAPVLPLAVAVGVLLAAGSHPAAADQPLRVAMHDMMPMQSQGQSGGPMGGMQMDPMRMPPAGQPGQMGGAQPQGQMGQGSPPDPMGAMRMQQQGQMGGGMQSQGSMGQGGAAGQMGSSGPMGGMGDNMMRMMNDHMRMMNDRMQMGGGMPGMAMGPGMVDMTDRFEGRLAFLRAELHITDAQSSAWNTFAEGLRSGRNHLLEARRQLNQPYASSVDRLAQYERHLTERLQALKSARTSFAQLYGALDDMQKRAADELIAPLIATF
jgi:hypothetical protein